MFFDPVTLSIVSVAALASSAASSAVKGIVSEGAKHWWRSQFLKTPSIKIRSASGREVIVGKYEDLTPERLDQIEAALSDSDAGQERVAAS